MLSLSLALPLCLQLLAAAPQPSQTEQASSQARSTTTTLTPSKERRSSLEVVSSADDLILLERSIRAEPAINASPDEGSIARLTANILARSHYARKQLDDDVSSHWLDQYIKNLDNLRLHFLQRDIDDFEQFRTSLDDLTRRGDTHVARLIFERFLERLDQRVVYVGELLKNETFTFEGDERYSLDRDKSPWPADLQAAKVLWRQHLRYEILQERLNAKPPGQSTAKTANPAPDAPSQPAAPAKEPAPSTVIGPNGLSEAIVKTIARRYARLLKTLRDFEGADVFQYYLTSLTHVYDPHSDYLGKASLENFAINMNLSLFGIGAVLQSEDGYCKVRELRPGPAMKSKRLKPGDRIVAVAQGDGEPVDVVDMKLSKVVELVRGPKGSTVKLTVIPADATDPSERRVVALVRDEIKLEDEEAKARILDIPNGTGRTNRIGVIDLPSFYANVDLGNRNGRSRAKSTTVDVARLLVKLKEEKVEGVILDLRRNGGGALEEAIDLTGIFIRKGPVVQVRDSLNRIMVDEDNNSMVVYDGPLVVLTSRFSASASEIVAAALQDYGRALIVGDSSTHGKGTVQSLIQLKPMLEANLSDPANDPGALKLTIRKFYRASGGSTQLNGVVPDLILPSVNNLAKVGESALDDPLPYDEIDPAPFEAENRIAPVLAELRQRSAQRVATDYDYAYIREDMETYRKHQEDKSVSLNEATRRKEKKELESREEARKQERKSRNEPADVVYEITLQQVDLPGLPAPLKETNSLAGATATPSTSLSLDDPAADAEDDKSPAVDPTLKEARRVLLDLAALEAARMGIADKRRNR